MLSWESDTERDCSTKQIPPVFGGGPLMQAQEHRAFDPER